MNTYLYIGNRPAKSSKADPRMKYNYVVCRFDSETGEATPVQELEFQEKFSAGGVYIDEKRAVLYLTNEVSDFPGLRGGGGGCIYAYRIDRESGKLSFMNMQPSYASKPNYIAVDDGGKYMLVSNHGERAGINCTERDAFGRFHVRTVYDESNVVLFPLAEDGRIGEALDIYPLSGQGPKHFQKSAHAHCVVKAPGRNLYTVCDKGGDQIFVFRIEENEGKLKLCDAPLHRMPGSAPRYGAYHPSQPFLYVNKESAQRLSVFRYDEEGKLHEVQVLDGTIPAGFPLPKEDDLYQSDLCMDPQGRCLYLLIRTADIINVYDIDGESGRLTLKQTLPANGSPRMCAISPDGRYLAVSYPDGGKIDLFAIRADGSIGEVLRVIEQPSPAALNFCVL